VDSIAYTLTISRKREVARYYFDPAESILYVCTIVPTQTSSDDFMLCHAPRGRGLGGTEIKWSRDDLNEAKKRDMTPTDVIRDRGVVVLATTPPFWQSTTYVMHVGNKTVVKCRHTLTQYTFEHVIDGQKVYFTSKKPDDYEYKCEQRYPPL
jgi:hypothetical protein